MNTQSLTYFGTLKVSGIDAGTFLQGQLTCDIREITSSQHQLGAFCNRQGRVLALMDIFRIQEDYFLTLPMELMDTIQKELQKYIVFSKAKIENISEEYQVVVNQTFLLNQMRALIPFIGLAQTGLFLPHPLGLVTLGAISFKKGCFVGQEIIARMQHRTQVKKGLAYAEIMTEAQPKIGEDILLDSERKGLLVNALQIGPMQYGVLSIVDNLQG